MRKTVKRGALVLTPGENRNRHILRTLRRHDRRPLTGPSGPQTDLSSRRAPLAGNASRRRRSGTGVAEQSFDSETRSARLLAIAVPILMLVTPFLGMVRDVGHSIWRSDTMACLGILSAVGVVCGALLSRRGRTEVLVMAALLTLTVDLLLAGRSYSASLLWLRPDPNISVEPVAAATLLLIALLICWLFQKHLLQILGAGFAVTLVTTVLMPTGAAAGARDIRSAHTAPSGNGPLVLHLILDEHIGLDGLPVDIPGSAHLRQTLVSLYNEFGFRLYERSYSIFTETRDALPNLVNFSSSDTKDAFVARHGSADNPSHTVTGNAYFRRLAQLGYRTHVYESTFMDFCGDVSGVVSDCYVYPVWGFDAAREAIPLGGRVRLLFSVYVKDSLVYYTAKHTLYKRLFRVFPNLVPWTWERGRTSPLTTMSALARLREDLTRASPGHAYFAHLLLPHSPDPGTSAAHAGASLTARGFDADVGARRRTGPADCIRGDECVYRNRSEFRTYVSHMPRPQPRRG